ncbi:hypothetical protein Pmar_PMAR004335 [Perkinsus marinus ATCC 50983]|uniref:K Homology domain-containing protein n=1 Tax=Perkinsus marinus (strain ATCC 50983 / TXsc) TaxID=423536 RepID=C5L5S6_PERM5|nr:hypothetical protein Pmar_PMAR004335 [Perkinsus marinus ATCC 50983]EER07916.1 hypothetical protein Pmar_PMAR004335 [Perkinsus marinus ATCC 50983]|eukprot:XP_002776100.1 hypothetical protein Pmar_PMAR004335 [Perkinsus marinus ATCC 50983]
MTVLDGFYDFFVSYASPYAPRSPSSSWNRESSWRGRRSSGGSSNNAWDTWSEEHKGGAGGGSQQWGGGRGEPWSAGRHGRITQRESVDEDRTIREHLKFRSRKPVDETLAVAARIVRDNENMMSIQSTVVIPDIPSHAAALIIGSQGAMIRELKDSSGANVVVKDRGDGRRNVLISGHLSAVHGAMLAVCELIRLAEEKRNIPGAISQRGGMRSLVAKMLALNQPGRELRKEEEAERSPGIDEDNVKPSKRARLVEVEEEPLSAERQEEEEEEEDLVVGGGGGVVASQPQSERTSEEAELVEVCSPPSSPRGDYEQ